MLEQAIQRIVGQRATLSREEARAAMGEVLAGRASGAQIGAFLAALAMRGETVDEIVGFAEAIRGAATALRFGAAGEAGASTLDASGAGRDALLDASLLDTCGTGGDAAGTFNISTATALVVAGAGVRVAKHGNRSLSSKCGSADVMEALGVSVDLAPEQLAACLEQVGIAFLFAPALHAAMKHVQPVRRELKLRTVFNLLGPLTNPAGASCQVVGVYSDDLVPRLAEALRMLKVTRALVVHGNDGLDEITITDSTRVAELRDGQITLYEVTPEQFGLKRASLADIAGGDAAENAMLIREVLAGGRSARREVVLLNAAAALVAAGRAATLAEGVPLAAESIDSGAARRKLEALVEFTRTKAATAGERAPG
ncbi:MAG TPA: anthranilate phosphoribosyltransferase [Terriglobales bacterium]|nr:anthranilate phosphoribosyltransferase [Terriglobales bacterium]